MKFTRDEIDALLFYQGSIENISNNTVQRMKSFYAIDQAYNVLNALLYPGIGDEKARIAEGKKLNQELVLHMPELLKIYCNIYSAMCKYTFFYEKNATFSTRRADREYSVREYKRGINFSFLSTTSKNQVDQYFCKKEGLVLLDVEPLTLAEHIDLNKVLGDGSEYRGEEEILYAPFLHVQLDEIQLNEHERRLRDCSGNPPSGKYKLRILDSLIEGRKWNGSISDIYEELELYQSIIDEEEISNVISVWKNLQERRETGSEQEQRYVEWKNRLQRYLKHQFGYIKSMIGDIMPMDRRFHEREQVSLATLLDEISEYKKWTNDKRIYYNQCLKYCNVALSILWPLAAVMIAISFVNEIEIIAKVVSIILVGVCAMIDKCCDAFGFKEKAEQRTLTYLRLDELEREIRYEPLMYKAGERVFLEKFMAVVDEDDRRCESNLQRAIRHMDDLAADYMFKEDM